MKLEVGKTVFNDYRLSVEVPDVEEGLKASDKGLMESTNFIVLWNHSDKRISPFGRFTLVPMPGCCGIIVSVGSYLEPGFRSQHNPSRWFHEIKEKVARHFGYSLMLMTTQTSNFPEVIGAAKSGWRLHHSFRNARTG